MGRRGRSESEKGENVMWASSGPPGEPLGSLLGRVEGLSSRLEAILGRLGSILGRRGGIVDELEGILDPCDTCGQSGRQYGNRLGATWRPSYPSWRPSCSSWRPSQGCLGPSWGPLGGLLGSFGLILGASWAILNAVMAQKANIVKMCIFRKGLGDFGPLAAPS